jgi:hypothetical protein
MKGEGAGSGSGPSNGTKYATKPDDQRFGRGPVKSGHRLAPGGEALPLRTL